MSNIEIKTDEGIMIMLEQSEASGTTKAGGLRMPSISDTFEKMLSPMLGCAKAFSKKLEEVSTIPNNPKLASVEFGLTLNLEGNFAIAKVGNQSHFRITLTWDETNKKDEK